MSYTDHAAQARSYASTAAAATRRAEREARNADESYRHAARKRREAARLTRNPASWMPEYGHIPAEHEREAATFVRIGDLYLHSSFRETGQAARYRELAARYRAMAQS